MLPNHPSQVLKQGQLADKLQRDYIQNGASKGRRARNLPTGSLMITARMGKDGRRNPVIMRQIRITLHCIKVIPGKGNKPNIQFYFDLAIWLISRQAKAKEAKTNREELPTPCRSLAEYRDDELLFLLQRHGQVEATLTCWDDMPKESLRALEKRLYHFWKHIKTLALSLRASTTKASNARRKKKSPMQRIASQLARIPIF